MKNMSNPAADQGQGLHRTGLIFTLLIVFFLSVSHTAFWAEFAPLHYGQYSPEITLSMVTLNYVLWAFAAFLLCFLSSDFFPKLWFLLYVLFIAPHLLLFVSPPVAQSWWEPVVALLVTAAAALFGSILGKRKSHRS